MTLAGTSTIAVVTLRSISTTQMMFTAAFALMEGVGVALPSWIEAG
ncbi:hypothetical protein [Streptomyces umbrinus]